jgi:hypothetical protein
MTLVASIKITFDRPLLCFHLQQLIFLCWTEKPFLSDQGLTENEVDLTSSEFMLAEGIYSFIFPLEKANRPTIVADLKLAFHPTQLNPKYCHFGGSSAC